MAVEGQASAAAIPTQAAAAAKPFRSSPNSSWGGGSGHASAWRSSESVRAAFTSRSCLEVAGSSESAPPGWL